MKFIDLLKMCLQNLFKRVSRTLMTVSGVTIGTSSVILMLSLGIGLDQSFNGFMESMGNLRNISVYPSYKVIQEDAFSSVVEANDDNLITEKDIENLKKIPGVKGVQAYMRLPEDYILLRIGDNIYRGQVSVIDFSSMGEFDFKASQGSIDGIQNPYDKIIFGSNAAYNFVPYDDPNFSYEYDEDGNPKTPPIVNLQTDTIEIHPKPPEEKKAEFDPTAEEDSQDVKLMEDDQYLYDTGVELSPQAVLEKDIRNYNTIEGVYIDITLARQLVEDAEAERTQRQLDEQSFKFGTYTNIEVMVDEVDNVRGVQDQIMAMGFDTFSMDDVRKEFSTFSLLIQLILGGLAGISLFVAAIGISNTMVMSITERTKEIGVMKVIGCEIKDIRKLFLMESGAIGFLGGLTGLIISYAVSHGVNILAANMGFDMMGGGGMGGGAMQQISIIPVWLASFAIIFATLIGLISGFSPANKAVKISPLEAIRHN